MREIEPFHAEDVGHQEQCRSKTKTDLRGATPLFLPFFHKSTPLSAFSRTNFVTLAQTVQVYGEDQRE